MTFDEREESMTLLADLDTFAIELDGEGWHNAASGCRNAKSRIDQLHQALTDLLARHCGLIRTGELWQPEDEKEVRAAIAALKSNGE